MKHSYPLCATNTVLIVGVLYYFLFFYFRHFQKKYLIFHMKIKAVIYYYICGILKTLLVFYV